MTDGFVKGKPTEEDRQATIEGYRKICDIVQKGDHDLVVIDEGNVAVKYGIIDDQDLISLFELKPSDMTLVVTGRGAAQKVMDHADRVFVLEEKKHYFKQGVRARIGVEK